MDKVLGLNGSVSVGVATLKIIGIKDGRVMIGIEAPRSVPIKRIDKKDGERK